MGLEGFAKADAVRDNATAEPFQFIDGSDDAVALDDVFLVTAAISVLGVLGACGSADFMYLQAATGLSKGNLSLHLGKLETG